MWHLSVNFAASLTILYESMNKIIAFIAVVVTAFSARAEGYQINTLSAKQGGMGHVGVAMKLGSESMFFNPAGLAFSNKTLDISGTLTGIKAIGTATVSGEKFKTCNGISTPISFNAAFKVYDNLQAGVSFYTPYGSSIDWSNDWPGAVLNQKVKLATYTIQPTLSWRILPKLSVGAALTMTWGSVDLYKGLVSAKTMDRVLSVLDATGALASMGIDPSYRFGNTTPASVNLNGTADMALGFHVGAMYDISSRVTVGVDYRSKVMMKVGSGDAYVNYANDIARGILEKDLQMINSANFKAEMPCPYVLNLGISYKPIDRLIIAADAQLTGWKTYKTLEIDFLNEKLSSFNQHLIKNYSNAWCFHLGAEYALTSRFDIRTGMMIDTTPIDKDYYNPETPGMTKIEPSAGFSFKPIPNFSINMSFMYVAGLGKKDAKCTYVDLLAAKMPALQLPAQATFAADYKVHAFVPSIGVSVEF